MLKVNERVLCVDRLCCRGMDTEQIAKILSVAANSKGHYYEVEVSKYHHSWSQCKECIISIEDLFDEEWRSYS